MASLVNNVHLLFGKCSMHLSAKVFFPLFYTDHLEDLLCGMHTSVLMMLQCVNAGGFPCQSLKYTRISSMGLQLVGNHRIFCSLDLFPPGYHHWSSSNLSDIGRVITCFSLLGAPSRLRCCYPQNWHIGIWGAQCKVLPYC